MTAIIEKEDENKIAKVVDAIRLVLSGGIGGIAIAHTISMSGIFTMSESIEVSAMLLGAIAMAVAVKKTGIL